MIDLALLRLPPWFLVMPEWLRERIRCPCCRGVPKMQYSTPVLPEFRDRVGYDVVVTCTSYYCRDRAARGLISLPDVYPSSTRSSAATFCGTTTSPAD